jgi:hypothetical protein
MRTIFHGACLFTALTFLVVSVGCESKPSDGNSSTGEHAHDEAGHEEHGHDEEHEGPHGGHVIELGRNHEYHAEIVEEEKSEKVSVYMLDKDLKELVIDQPSITMNLKVDGEGQSFVLSAVGATDGKASQFDAPDHLLFEALHEHEATGKLSVTINGSPVSGEVEHHHHGEEDHDEHKH